MSLGVAKWLRFVLSSAIVFHNSDRNLQKSNCHQSLFVKKKCNISIEIGRNLLKPFILTLNICYYLKRYRKRISRTRWISDRNYEIAWANTWSSFHLAPIGCIAAWPKASRQWKKRATCWVPSQLCSSGHSKHFRWYRLTVCFWIQNTAYK